MPAKLKLREEHIRKAVCDLLELDGWRHFRTELTIERERGRVVGERGMPDDLFIRYLCPKAALYSAYRHSMAEVLWIEFKRPGGQLSPHQVIWHTAEVSRGALVLLVDDIDRFRAWYRASGLERRR